jgi:hypothetical protein
LPFLSLIVPLPPGGHTGYIAFAPARDRRLPDNLDMRQTGGNQEAEQRKFSARARV